MRHTRRTTKATTHDPTSAREHYQREKARRARRVPIESEAIAAARREYLALLASDAAKGKGGRPRKNAARPTPHGKEGEADKE
jgi:hypothetical protein